LTLLVCVRLSMDWQADTAAANKNIAAILIIA
jgi:hypothetical protein